MLVATEDCWDWTPLHSECYVGVIACSDLLIPGEFYFTLQKRWKHDGVFFESVLMLNPRTALENLTRPDQ